MVSEAILATPVRALVLVPIPINSVGCRMENRGNPEPREMLLVPRKSLMLIYSAAIFLDEASVLINELSEPPNLLAKRLLVTGLQCTALRSVQCPCTLMRQTGAIMD